MKTLFIILLVIVLVPVAFFVFALIANIYLLATGKMTKAELASKAETYNAEKRKKKQEKKQEKNKKKNAVLLFLSIVIPMLLGLLVKIHCFNINF